MGEEKMKRKLNVLIVVLLICLSSVLIIPDDLKVKASGEGGEDGGIQLPYDFVWNITKWLSDVIFDANYSNPDIRKGRAWATEGENYTIERILIPEMNKTLDNVQKLLIGYINETYSEYQYSSKVVTNDFQLIINNKSGVTYPYDQYVPKSEVFPWPAGYPDYINCLDDYNSSFDNIRIREPLDEKGLWPLASTYNDYYKNVTCGAVNDCDILVGNATYIKSGESIPDDQIGRVFLIHEEAGCEDKLDNISEAGCILLHDYGREIGYFVSSTSKYFFPIIRVDNESDNMTDIKQMLDNGNHNLIDNAVDTELLTFTNNLTEGELPSLDYVVILQVPNPYETGTWKWFGTHINIRSAFLWHLNQRRLVDCRGLIMYEYQPDVHMMGPTTKGWEYRWEGSSFPALPVFSINGTVGSWLYDHRNDPTAISGYLDQEFKEETESTPGVTSYNTVGFRNTTESPDDAIVLISNRIDGMWGQTPGDSGVGGAIVLGIAKYFNDFDITPKYNLTFLFTTGEEYGMRGAYHYRDSHPNENFIRFIGTDQLAFNQEDTNLSIGYIDDTTYKIISQIAEDTNYETRTGYGLDFTDIIAEGAGSEDLAWSETCDTIGIGKDNTSIWTRYHRTGMNYIEGDSLKYTDRNDVNVTFELAWNLTKYFTIDPDCWFSNVTYDAYDSPNDGDSLPDSIRANFTIDTVMPHDLNRMKVDLFQGYGGQGSQGFYENVDYIVKSPGSNYSYTFTIPDVMMISPMNVDVIII